MSYLSESTATVRNIPVTLQPLRMLALCVTPSGWRHESKREEGTKQSTLEGPVHQRVRWANCKGAEKKERKKYSLFEFLRVHIVPSPALFTKTKVEDKNTVYIS